MNLHQGVKANAPSEILRCVLGAIRRAQTPPPARVHVASINGEFRRPWVSTWQAAGANRKRRTQAWQPWCTLSGMLESELIVTRPPPREAPNRLGVSLNTTKCPRSQTDFSPRIPSRKTVIPPSHPSASTGQHQELHINGIQRGQSKHQCQTPRQPDSSSRLRYATSHAPRHVILKRPRIDHNRTVIQQNQLSLTQRDASKIPVFLQTSAKGTPTFGVFKDRQSRNMSPQR